MLDTFNIWLWFSVAFLQSHFAAMLSLDFLDDVRRMNKRQVGKHRLISQDFAAASLYELKANVSRYARFDAQLRVTC